MLYLILLILSQSYGTILGATLAAMYPERIKRAVLDGVADSHDCKYYRCVETAALLTVLSDMAGGWTSNLRDTDLLFVRLASYCFEGGPQNCPIYNEDGPAVISQTVQDILANLKTNPVSVLDVEGRGPQIATLNDFSMHLRDIVYNPLKYFPVTTKILYELSQGDGTSLAAWKLSLRPNFEAPIPEKCTKDGPFSPSCFTADDLGGIGAATSAIACSDAVPDRLDQTKESYWEYAKKIMGQSRLMGAWWASIQMPCTAWKARAHWRYDG